jgi:hypothetical protein
MSKARAERASSERRLAEALTAQASALAAASSSLIREADALQKAVEADESRSATRKDDDDPFKSHKEAIKKTLQTIAEVNEAAASLL